jgi:cell division protein FtsW (lipid II flippase)
MGPGYFPLILGVILAFIGLVIAFKATVKGPDDGDKIGKWAWKQVFFILAANFAFGILLVGVPALGIPVWV